MNQMSTSAEAWERVQLTLRESQEAAFQALASVYPQGMTDDELRHALHTLTGHRQSKSGPATRRGELVELGLVRIQRDDDRQPVRRTSDSGGPMTVWEVVPSHEYIEPEPTSPWKSPTAKGLQAARARSEWETGDANWANVILRAYLNPELDSAELEEERRG